MPAVRRLAGLLVLLVALAAGSSSAATPSPVLLPDMKLVVPTDLISIGLDGNGQRELRYTHITADIGPGSFEIDPHYDKQTGVSTFTQALHRRNGSVAERVPLATYGTWEPPSDYRFPLSSFTLNEVGPDNTVAAAVVARSPKVDYCMTGDVQVPGYKDPPPQSFIPAENCADPTSPLGWSAGWGDEYDQTDAGQPISLAGVPDGTYVLRATVDPEHVLREVTTANDVTDTTLTITGNQVTVVSQKVTDVPFPRVRLAGDRAVTATVTPPPGETVSSVQFILDGRPVGRAQTAAPYTLTLKAGPGVHYVSARATDADGVMGSAPVRRIVVPNAPAIRVTRLVWRAGVLELRFQPPRGTDVTAIVGGKRHRVTRGSLDLRVPRPRQITLEITSPGGKVAKLVLPLDSQPAVDIVNPGPNETVSGLAPVAVDATDAVGVTGVRLTVDGKPTGPVLRTPPFRVTWDTRKLADGPHTLAARVTSATGARASASETVDVSNPAPPMTCFVLQHQESVHGQSPVTTGEFQTVMPGETLLALVSADGPQSAPQTATVAGGGLTWKLVSRANASPGDSEIWEAVATTATTISPISATLASGGYDESLSLVAMEGADGVGAKAHASGPDGAPHLALKTLAAASLVFAAGNDWDRAAARKLPVGWVILDQWLNSGTGDTYWSQYTNHPAGKAGTRIRVRDTAPTNDSWNLAAVELVSSGD